jgi:hypothetical protein
MNLQSWDVSRDATIKKTNQNTAKTGFAECRRCFTTRTIARKIAAMQIGPRSIEKLYVKSKNMTRKESVLRRLGCARIT